MERPVRQRIMEAAHNALAERGAGALSIERICTAARVDRSELSQHFADRVALIRSLLQLYLEQEEWLFDSTFGRGHELSHEPLQGTLAGLSLLAQAVAAAPRDNPIRLAALGRTAVPVPDRGMAVLIRDGADRRRSRFRTIYDDIARQHVPQTDIDPDDFADLAATLIEASPMSSRGEDALCRQIGVLRTVVRLIFQPTADLRSGSQR